MGAHLYEWMSLAIRWLHVVAGITWIGESFYFMWLDASLERRAETPEDESLVLRLAERSVGGTESIRELIVSLVRTEAFMTRSVEELP